MPELLREVETHGGTVEVVGSQLALDSPIDFPEPLVEELRQRKPEVIAHLAQGLIIEAEIAQLLNCHVCGANEWWPRHDGVWTCGRCHPQPPGGSMRMKGFPGR